MKTNVLLHFLVGLVPALPVLFLPAALRGEVILVEAESAVAEGTEGGWKLDQQLIDQIGSSVLLAHGLGEPVADAEMKINVNEPGRYQIFARTRNWTAPWNEAAGTFTLTIDGKEIDHQFGAGSAEWEWEPGGEISLMKGEHKIALHDQTGFDGRIDAVCLSNKPGFVPPNRKEELTQFRRQTLGLPETPALYREKPYDLVVVGGGMAGTCAAVSAARLGLDTILIQNRFLLGGNNSSEIRVHLQGLINLPPYPNLGNLVYQLQPDREGNAEPAEYYEDNKKLELVRAEPNVTLQLGFHVCDVEKEGNRIIGVIAKDVLTGAEYRINGTLFADCTGDANLGFLAGADWRMGRESKSETGETTAPDEPDDLTMGASIQWYALPAETETAFPELPWAIQFTPESIRPAVHGDWDWETGLNWNQIDDIEKIRDHGLRAAFGHWAYMKNHADGEWAETVKTMKLGWVSYTAGKRESRRLMGDLILKEQDITAGTVWPDATVTTTWAIDLHYPDPKNTKFFPGEEFRAICKTIVSPPYAIPYRCFYSRNIENLFMAGRDISVTHAALGTVRVMRTGGMMGEVVGMAASVCKKQNALPRDVYEKYFPKLQELMTRGVAPEVPGRKEVLPPKWAAGMKNLAPAARVSAYEGADDDTERLALLTDGKADPSDDSEAYQSEPAAEKEVRFTFGEPTTVSGLHFITADEDYHIRNHFVLQSLSDDGSWADVPGTFVKNRHGVDFDLRFPPVTAKVFRLVHSTYYGHNIPWKLWEVELY